MHRGGLNLQRSPITLDQALDRLVESKPWLVCTRGIENYWHIRFAIRLCESVWKSMFVPPANFEKCNLQNAKCNMQNAKCKMKLQFQIEVLTCSYLQTTSLHFVPRFVSPSQSKILFEYMSGIWQPPKFLANAVPKYKSQHPCNLNMKQIRVLNPSKLSAYLSVCKQIGQPTMCQYWWRQVCIL